MKNPEHDKRALGAGKRRKKNTPTFAELRAWVATVKLSSISRAAEEELGVASVSAQQLVRKLSEKVERIIGDADPTQQRDARLYDYNFKTRKIEPTVLGEKLSEAVAQAISDIGNVERLIPLLETQDKTSLAIAASSGVWEDHLFGTVGEIQRDYKDLELEMLVRGSDDALKLVRNRECDLAFVGRTTLEKEQLPQRLRSAPFKAYPVGLYLRRDSELARDQDFTDYCAQMTGNRAAIGRVLKRVVAAGPLILPGTWAGFRRDMEKRFQENGVDFSSAIIHDFDTHRGKIRAAAAGLGTAILWRAGNEDDAAILQCGPDTTEEQNSDDSSLQHLCWLPLPRVFPDYEIWMVWDELVLSEPARKIVETTLGKANVAAGPE